MPIIGRFLFFIPGELDSKGLVGKRDLSGKCTCLLSVTFVNVFFSVPTHTHARRVWKIGVKNAGG